MTKKHQLFADILERFSKESHCESKKVAALAVKNNRIIATGINGTPAGTVNCDDHFREEHGKRNMEVSYEKWIKTTEWRNEHHQWSNFNEIHAEQSLICEAARNGISLKDVDIYVSLQPCTHCSKLLAALKPNNIFYINDYDKGNDESKELLDQAGINMVKIC